MQSRSKFGIHQYKIHPSLLLTHHEPKSIKHVLISVAFLALSFVVVGKEEKWLAIGVTIIGTTIMATTLGTMCYWVIRHRIETSNLRSIRKSSLQSKSKSFSVSAFSDSELLNSEYYKKMYAI